MPAVSMKSANEQYKVGVLVSYKEVQLVKEPNINSKINPILSHFSKGEFTIGALDSFDNNDTLSLSGKFSYNDTVTTFFQVKPEQPPRKPGKTQKNIT